MRKISIESYKSIRKLTLDLGQVNVLIGANGSGKSNILEAIVYGLAATRDKLDNEYLVPRGVRVVEPRFMRSAFSEEDRRAPRVVLSRTSGEEEISIDSEQHGALWSKPQKELKGLPRAEAREELIRRTVERILLAARFPDFVIYAPENSALRVFQSEPQLSPLGVKGEGLFAHLKALNSETKTSDRLIEIGDHLALLDWFERLEIPKDLAPGERTILIRDRYLAEGALFDQRSANEGFLFLLFYLTLFSSDATPSFFAVDNIDTSLNPKLVTRLVTLLVALAKRHDKQVIFTTHNPAVLDGIDIHDNEQRLFVTERARDGSTRARRVNPPKPLEGDAPVPLSDAFVRGYLGGLPKNF